MWNHYSPIWTAPLSILLLLGATSACDGPSIEETLYEDVSTSESVIARNGENNNATYERRGQCESETYYYTVSGSTKSDAFQACETICEGVLCPDWTYSAHTRLGANYARDAWLCDCICLECDNEDTEPSKP